MTKLHMELIGDTQVRMTRLFAASPEALFRAHTEAALLQKWMLGPPGWTMPHCQSDPRVGGGFRCDWTDGQGGDFYITGDFIVLEPPHRIVHVERMFLPEPTADNTVETVFETVEGGSKMTIVMSVPTAEDRTAMLATGVEEGMAACYDLFDDLHAKGEI